MSSIAWRVRRGLQRWTGSVDSSLHLRPTIWNYLDVPATTLRKEEEYKGGGWVGEEDVREHGQQHWYELWGYEFEYKFDGEQQ